MTNIYEDYRGDIPDSSADASDFTPSEISIIVTIILYEDLKILIIVT